jgi:hypothetical protein
MKRLTAAALAVAWLAAPPAHARGFAMHFLSMIPFVRHPHGAITHPDPRPAPHPAPRIPVAPPPTAHPPALGLPQF